MGSIKFRIQENDGFRDYLLLDNLEDEIAEMIYPNITVIQDTKFKLKFNDGYIEITTNNRNGFTRTELVRKINELYPNGKLYKVYQNNGFFEVCVD